MWHLQNLKLALQTMMLVFLLAGAAIAQEIVRIGNVPLPSDAIEAREGRSEFAGTCWIFLLHSVRTGFPLDIGNTFTPIRLKTDSLFDSPLLPTRRRKRPIRLL